MEDPSEVMQASPATEIDSRTFRDALGCFASGVVVISGMSGGDPVGFTCQSFTSLSMTPPMVAFCPSVASVTWRQIRSAGAFCVNILSESQRRTSDVFAQRRDDKFAGISWRPGLAGAPLIDDALAHIECEIESVYPGGDHDIVLGRVVRLGGTGRTEPLLYYRGRYARLLRSG
ncbi:flavin reductase family protein [Microbispora sp. CA-102843]|uniref:flavin reductase family protein n=1 Tax=Microbispora sp. CA-102843 TaxID=3239952 RepID=UPI003D89F536